MRHQLILHLVCICLVAAAWVGVIIKLGQGKPGAADPSAVPISNQPIAELVPSGGVDPALIAERSALEAEIRDLLTHLQSLPDNADGTGRRIHIPKAFFDAPEHFLSPFIQGDTGEKLGELLRINVIESVEVDAALDQAIAAAQAFESAELSIETTPDGFPMYRVPAWGEVGDDIVGDLRAQLGEILGADRGDFYIDGYVIKELLRRQDHELRIYAKPARGSSRYPSLQVRTVGPETGASGDGDYMVWLTGKNPKTGKFIDRYGHLLGVGSAEELTTMVSAIPE